MSLRGPNAQFYFAFFSYDQRQRSIWRHCWKRQGTMALRNAEERIAERIADEKGKQQDNGDQKIGRATINGKDRYCVNVKVRGPCKTPH
uniref:Uncharacterized protein n=1 Tax=Romanomermis culicivorax TaxID=13658 RepID=A0A915JZU9_ROMCU